MQLRQTFFFIAGICFLALAKAKSLVKGYQSPKPFDISETSRCIEYDIQVIEQWLYHLRSYNNTDSLVGKTILELGPGSDLGIGIFLLSKGCSQYHACDVNDLVRWAPDKFYQILFEKLELNNNQESIYFLREQLRSQKRGCISRLNYVVDKNFDLVSAFGRSNIDLVFSQAAFEHFDDIKSTISQLSEVCKSGAVLVAEVGLKTHSRWIRDKDPNNIYRYPKWLYDLFWFRGIPNRRRPLHYKQALEQFGWRDITITPLEKLDDQANSCTGLNRMFSEINNQMSYLSIMLCARKS